MDLFTTLPAFLIAIVLISASPGPAMALILRRAALRGFRATVPTVLGLEAGLFAWALAAAAGFAALVAASEIAFVALRVVGAAVLLLLGARALRCALRRSDSETPELAPTAEATAPLARGAWWRAFGEGLAVQLANPKAAVFMLALYPQFVPPGSPLLATTVALAVVQVTVEITLYLALAAGVGRARGWFRRPVVRRRLDLVSGGVLVALGLRVAASSR